VFIVVEYPFPGEGESRAGRAVHAVMDQGALDVPSARRSSTALSRNAQSFPYM
jgi:hypothetical protein